MDFYVEKAVREAGVKILFAVMRGIDNSGTNDEWMTLREEKLRELLRRYNAFDVHLDPVLEGYNILHDRTGVKRRKNIPASENLIRLLVKHGGMNFINTAVDIYNMVSLETRVALGAHDIAKVGGDVTLRFTRGDERFLPIGQNEAVKTAPHEYSYIDDDNDILCRLEIRQARKTIVTEETRDIFYIVQGNDAARYDYLRSTALEIISLTKKYCGGEGTVITPKEI